MSRTRILQVGPLLPELDKRLGEHFDVHALYLENDRAAFLAANGASFEGIATSARYGKSWKPPKSNPCQTIWRGTAWRSAGNNLV